MLGTLREYAARLRDPNPFDDVDERRKWNLAQEVSNGPASAIYAMVRFKGARRSHALFEGYTGTEHGGGDD